MKTHNRSQIHSVDVHAALARAQADRAEYVRTAITAVPALVKRLAAQIHTSHRRLPQTRRLRLKKA
jgi:hypothetical protein